METTKFSENSKNGYQCVDCDAFFKKYSELKVTNGEVRCPKCNSRMVYDKD